MKKDSTTCNFNIHCITFSVKEVNRIDIFSLANVALDLWKFLLCSTIYLRADPILTYDQYCTTTTTTYGKIIAITILLLCHPENPMNELMKGKYHYLYNFNVNTTHNYKNE